MQQDNTRKVNIVYLPHRRLQFSSALLSILSKADKSKFHLSIMIYGERIDEFQPMLKSAQDLGISCSIEVACHININNYMHKIQHAVNLPYEYSMKLDEDIFVSQHVFDYLFTSGCDLLNDENNLFVSPALSNGIPSVRDFMDHQLNDEGRTALYSAFSKTNIPGGLWGVNWNKEQSVLRAGYTHDKWFSTVQSNPHFYKGLHPIRCDWNSQLLMNTYVKNRIAEFSIKKEYSIKEMHEPYFCNSIFLIKTKVWKSIIENKSLFVDDFDEVPLNKYWKQSGKKAWCINNAFGIHTMYNTLEDIPRRDQAEHQFFAEIKDYL